MNLKFILLICFLCAQSANARSGGTVGSGGGFSLNGKVDVLFLVDTSSSIASKRKLADTLQTYIEWMQSLRMDFQIGVTTLDMSLTGEKGRLIGSPAILGPQTPNLVQKFKARIVDVRNGSPVERGLLASTSSLEANPAFSRDGALLILVYISDEDDGSAGNANDYAAKLDKLTASSSYRRWVANFIGALPGDKACDFSPPGIRYLELVTPSGGFAHSICDSENLEIATQLAAQTR